ncbi:MAG TPA: hypothetical protein H9664_00205 [Firmicutes bacterium]|nr:hypothetical protein [Bacillota bacterium]
MSYCVNCGVELEKSEKRCPLCGVEVINPAQPPEDKEPRQRPYPNRIEELSMNINKQFAAALLSVFMVFAAAICCVCNIIIDKSITWSQYVIGAIFFTWVAVTVPLLFKRAVLIKSIVLDIAALLFFLFMVSRLDGSRPWFTTVAVPIVSVVASMTLIIVLGVKYNYIRGLSLPATIFFCAGLLCLLIEIFVDIYLYSAVSLGWSIFVLVPCIFVFILLLILKRTIRIKRELKKRLHI